MKKSGFKAWILLFILMAMGCASTVTRQDQYIDSEKFVAEGNFEKAIKVIEAAKEKVYKKKDRVLYWIDLGLLRFYNGDHEDVIPTLTDAEYAIEELFTKSVSKAIGSGILNDNALDYYGEDYEDLYLNIFKCISYIEENDYEDAFVEIKRLDIKLNMLEDKYKKIAEEYNSSDDAVTKLNVNESQFHNDVLARYMSFLMYRAEEDIDNAAIDLKKLDQAFISQPSVYYFNQPSSPELYIPEDMAAVNFLSFTGLGPVKNAETIYIDGGGSGLHFTIEGQSKNYLNSVIGYTFIPFPGVDGFHMKMQFPTLKARGSRVDQIKVFVDGSEYANLELIEDMSRIADATFEVKRPIIIGKTIIRAITKGVVKEIGQEVAGEALEQSLGIGGALLSLFVDVASDVAVDATENADLRISHFMPSYAYVGEIFLNPGTYDIEIAYYSGGSLIYVDKKEELEVDNDELNLVNSFFLQ